MNAIMRSVQVGLAGSKGWVATALIVSTCASPTLAADECTTIAVDAPIARLGSFTNVRCSDVSGDTECGGCTVELWRTGECLFGILYVDAGLVGNTPRALVDSVLYDPASGALTFVSRLPTKAQYRVAGSNYSSPVEYVFKGRLGSRRITGDLVMRLSPPPLHPPTPERVKLEKEHDEDLEAIRTYGEWKEWASSVHRLWAR
jgi:hypothetical protein